MSTNLVAWGWNTLGQCDVPEPPARHVVTYGRFSDTPGRVRLYIDNVYISNNQLVDESEDVVLEFRTDQIPEGWRVKEWYMGYEPWVYEPTGVSTGTFTVLGLTSKLYVFCEFESFEETPLPPPPPPPVTIKRAMYVEEDMWSGRLTPINRMSGCFVEIRELSQLPIQLPPAVQFRLEKTTRFSETFEIPTHGHGKRYPIRVTPDDDRYLPVSREFDVVSDLVKTRIFIPWKYAYL